MSNFTLVILKYTDLKSVVSYEKEFINLLKPEYNVNFTKNFYAVKNKKSVK
jgi:hypothetical protein